MIFQVCMLLICLVLPIGAQDLSFYYEDADQIEQMEPRFISLGRTCHVALGLKAINLRDASYPFDWIITSDLDTLIHALDDKLEHYTDPEHFALSHGWPHALNTLYGLQFIHDFTPDEGQLTEEIAAEEWVSFKERYDRRVERFKNLDHYPGKVFFLRSMWDYEYEGANGEFLENSARAERLRDALRDLFPNLDFTLVIFTRPELNIPPIENLAGVVEIRMSHAHGRPLYEKLMELAYGPEDYTSQTNTIIPTPPTSDQISQPPHSNQAKQASKKHKKGKKHKKSKKHRSHKKKRKSR